MKKLAVILVVTVIILKVVFAMNSHSNKLDNNEKEVEIIFRDYLDKKYPDNDFEFDSVFRNSIGIDGASMNFPRFMTEYTGIIEEQDKLDSEFRITYKVSTRKITENYKESVLGSGNAQYRIENEFEDYLSRIANKGATNIVSVSVTLDDTTKNKITNEMKIEEFIEKYRDTAKMSIYYYLYQSDTLVLEIDEAINRVEEAHNKVFDVLDINQITKYTFNMTDHQNQTSFYVEMKKPYLLNRKTLSSMLNLRELGKQAYSSQEKGEYQDGYEVVVLDNKDLTVNCSFYK